MKSLSHGNHSCNLACRFLRRRQGLLQSSPRLRLVFWPLEDIVGSNLSRGTRVYTHVRVFIVLSHVCRFLAELASLQILVDPGPNAAGVSSRDVMCTCDRAGPCVSYTRSGDKEWQCFGRFM
jgi:hypothetical protein